MNRGKYQYSRRSIEYSLPGITQVQVVREKGIDFLASALFLRQDPDVGGGAREG